MSFAKESVNSADWELKSSPEGSGLCLALGFACYAGLMYFLYDKYVKDEGKDAKILYGIFAGIWGVYGISYLLPIRQKNISYNILDLISKAGFGVFIWLSMVMDSPTQNVAIANASS